MPSPETYERSEIQVSDYATYRDFGQIQLEGRPLRSTGSRQLAKQ
jgi:hypothetical protein